MMSTASMCVWREPKNGRSLDKDLSYSRESEGQTSSIEQPLVCGKLKTPVFKQSVR